DVYFYDVLAASELRTRTHTETLRALAGWGLKVSDLVRPARTVDDHLRERVVRPAGRVDDILAYHAELGARRDDLPYEIDGIVIKLDDLRLRDEMGMTARHPRWAFAFKFPPRKEVTRIEKIVPSVGRSGIVTPVALLRPVELGGGTVARDTRPHHAAGGRPERRAV